MEFKKWKNKYIELVSSKPGKLLPCVDEEFSAQEEELLRDKLNLYSQIYCDLGSGSGGHALEQARRNPESLLIGVELRYKRAFRTIEKADLLGLQNVLVIRTDARIALPKFPDARISGFFINFPDPWEKRRWHKNRLINNEFVALLISKLKPGGFISHKSDHIEYFNSNLGIFRNFNELQIENISYDWHRQGPEEMQILSEFEKLFRSQGHPVNFLLARKGLGEPRN